jgi:hypothetical protein
MDCMGVMPIPPLTSSHVLYLSSSYQHQSEVGDGPGNLLGASYKDCFVIRR